MLRLPPRKRLRGLRARRALDRRKPAEERALDAERLAQPAPEIEAILVADDPAVAKRESRVDPVFDVTPGRGKRVAGDPVRAAGRRVGIDIGPDDAHGLTPGAEQLPHRRAA